MDTQPSKKRKLAPKAAMAQEAQYDYNAMPAPSVPIPNNERTDFESFARHLQDAAMLIYAQANRSPYTSVSVLLLRWEDDVEVEQDLVQLQKVFQERFNYRTESWNIPSCPNPGVKLMIQLAQHVESAPAEHLLIVYYAGYGFMGTDHHLYWACNPHEEAPKLKYEGVKCVLEDATSDILLLLDTVAITDAAPAGSHGIKQAIAAYGQDHVHREPGGRTFTSHLVEALNTLSNGKPISTQRLHEEIISLSQNRFSPLTNGASKAAAGQERLPVCFTLTSGNLQSIALSPLGLQRPIASSLEPPEDMHVPTGVHDENHQIGTKPNADVTFEEMRALVCTTFVGEPSPDMASFKNWLNNAPAMQQKIAVEGMFHGPPTILLISMPIAVWNVVAVERTCLFLGYISSHNMKPEYQLLIDAISPGLKAATYREVEDGKILLEAREAAASTPIMLRHSHDPMGFEMIGSQNSVSPDLSRTDPLLLNTIPQSLYPEPGPSIIPGHEGNAEDSVEMHEAAEQLKALSHVRHLSHDRNERNHSHLTSDDSPLRSGREDSISSQEQVDSAGDEHTYNSEYNSAAVSRPKPRKSAQKQGPKQDTRCTMCSHAPFKDSSSLRKHVAAAHTRPFPCAFAFAGCASTFGSKNEWKRHIASQHLCLTFYRCSSCPQSSVEGKGNEFNRKDLFTQHLRRMHAPFAIKKALAKGESKLQTEWEAHVKEMQITCLVTRRLPPQRSSCPKQDCSNLFEGAGSWDDWTEHVGRHMEKGEAGRLGIDNLLAQWALAEGIIEEKGGGEYRLCGADRDVGTGGYYSGGELKLEKMEGDGHMLLDA